MSVVGKWKSYGPIFPIECSHIAENGQMRFVIDATSHTAVQSRFAYSARSVLMEAVEDLRVQDNLSLDDIGFTDFAEIRSSVRANPEHSIGHVRVIQWLEQCKISAAIWIASSPNFYNQTGRKLTMDSAAKHLKSLPAAQLKLALRYLQKHAQNGTRLQHHLLKVGASCLQSDAAAAPSKNLAN